MRPATLRSRFFATLSVTALLFLTACARTPEGREADHMQKGKNYVTKKDYRKAVIEFKIASQNMPKDAEPFYQLGMTYLRGGAGRQAVESFQRAVDLNPKHQEAQYQLALFKVGSSKPETVQEAGAFLLEYIKVHPDNAEALGSLALADAKLGDKDGALKMLSMAESKDPSSVRSAARVISIYAAKGDAETAKQIARDISGRLPNSPDAATLRAEVSLAMRDLADADAQISRALSLKRDFRPALELRLRREFMNGDQQGAEQTTQQLAELPQERTWGAYARLLFSEKKADQGIAEFERALKEHGDNNDLRNDYSSTLLNYGRTKEAAAVVAGTLKKAPKDRVALMQRVTIELDGGDVDAADKDVKVLHDLKVFSPQLNFDESRIAGARGETIREGDLLTTALRQNPRFLQARLELSRLLVASGKARDAIGILDQASPVEKRTADYFFFRNTALITAGDWDEAKKGVATAVKVSPTPRFLYQDAVLRLRDHDLPGARKSLEAAIQIAPDAATLSLLGDVMRQQKEFPKYMAMLKDAAAKNPGSAPLQDTLGRQLASTGDWNGARTAYEAALNDGDTINATCEIALIDLAAGKPDAARQRLLDLIKNHDNARARIMLAELEAQKGSPDVVIQHYLKAISLAPQNAEAMNNLAGFLAEHNKFDDALFWAQKALAQAPNSPVVEDTIGWTYFREAKYDAALPFLEKSLKGLDRPTAHYHLAAVLLNTGDPVRAKKEYDIALKVAPKSPERSLVGPLFDGGKHP